jgi:hypothetical protein
MTGTAPPETSRPGDPDPDPDRAGTRQELNPHSRNNDSRAADGVAAP